MFGRDDEIAAVVGSVEAAATASTILLISGPPGIGKSALLAAGGARADELGYAVVAARPTAAEATLGFAALGDLVQHADLDLLNDVARVALETALGLRAAVGDPPPPSALGRAVVQLVAARRSARPLLVVLDDLQWVDAATRDVLAFAARRLPPTGVCVLAAQRTTATPIVDVPEAKTLALRPLARRAIVQVVESVLATRVPDDVVARLVTAAHGNPLFAIELGHAAATATVRHSEPLPLPPSLGSAIAARLESLSPATTTALAALSMVARPTVAMFADLDLLDDLDPAGAAGVVTISGKAISFTHPLLASAAHDAVAPVRRMELRRRLAEVTTGVERSIHLALGATHPDPAIGAALATAAGEEFGRGAFAEAAHLATLALEATPAGDATVAERLLLAADTLYRSGRTADAIEHFHRAVAATADDRLRARALLSLATIEYDHSDDANLAIRLATEALTLTDDVDVLADAHSVLSFAHSNDFAKAAEHAAAALTLIGDRPDPEPLRLAQALNAAATAQFYAGAGLDRTSFERAIALESGSEVAAADSAFGALAAHLKFADELDESIQMFEQLTTRADAASLPFALSHLPQAYLWAGRWDEAAAAARRHLDVAERTEQASQVSQARFNLALVAAHLGEVGDARQLGAALAATGTANDDAWTTRNGEAILGFAAMTTNDAVDAVAHFRRYEALGIAIGLGEPSSFRYAVDFAEALVATGAVDEATAVLDRHAARAERTGRVSARAAVARGRALVAAHGGRRDEAFASAEEAVAELDGGPLAYERARALLTLGVVARRFKDRSRGRRALDGALAEFERMGAAALAARTRLELARVDGRTTTGPGALAQLTATESRVAELAAAGETTRQIADALFISAKTVEANLTRIYRKLGVANRAQLATLLGTER